MFSFLNKNKSNSKRIYLDNAGSTPTSKLATSEFSRVSSIFGNPSAIYKEGVEAKNILNEAKEKIGKIINARTHEIYFTGSGTESCNLAILGTYKQWKKENEYSNKLPHIIISSIEHPSVMELVNYLSINSLINVTYLPVYEDGLIKVEDIRKAITEDTILVSVMYANNEIGTVEPIKEIGRMIQEIKSQKSKVKTTNHPYFHTDACQAGNYLNLDTYRLRVDMMTVNSSKVYGPKGVAILYKKEGIDIEPVSFGGGQERGLRSGTENVAGAYSFACALEESQELREKESERLKEIRDDFKNKLEKKIPEVTFYGVWGEDRLPNNINCRIPNIGSDEMIIRLDNLGFAVSHKSACASQVDDGSYVIKALGATDNEAKENIRITMGRDTTKEDMNKLVEAIFQIYSKFAK